MNKKYEHIFFDLDHTLWDFETNSAESLEQIFDEFELTESGIANKEIFIERYHHHNEIYWSQFHRGEITRETLRYIRFKTTLEEFGIKHGELGEQMAESYLQILPTKKKLFIDTIDVLDYLFPKYKLHIITNGFHEVQEKKIVGSNLKKYFSQIITSEIAGAQKPEREIFKFAFERSGAKLHNSIFVGDSLEADVEGAKNYGMDYVFYNPKRTIHDEIIMHEIAELVELKKML